MKRLILPALLSLPAWAPAAELRVVEDEATIRIFRGESPVLTYHKAEVPPPQGADPLFTRSGFIHPLCTPAGEPVTGIHPSDHFHHLGLWHAWVKTKHGEDEPDFWNLKAATGRVRYAKTLSLAPDGASGFTVEQEHVAYKGAAKAETVVLREALTVTARVLDGRHVIGYHVVQNNVSDAPLELPAYRYGGCFAYRAPHHWDRTNSDCLTSEGKTRDDSHATRAKWVAITGPTDRGDATLAVLFHPKNHDFPQRLRTWPADTQNGAIFLNVVPTQEHPWSIAPGQAITMAYTLVVADEKPDPVKIESWWSALAAGL